MEDCTSDPLHTIANGGCRHEHEETTTLNGTTMNSTSDPVDSQESDCTSSTASGGDTVNRRRARGDRQCLIKLRSMVVVFEEDISVGGKLCKARLEDDHLEWITGKGNVMISTPINRNAVLIHLAVAVLNIHKFVLSQVNPLNCSSLTSLLPLSATVKVH